MEFFMNLINKIALSAVFVSTIALPSLPICTIKVGQEVTIGGVEYPQGKKLFFMHGRKQYVEPVLIDQSLEFVRSYMVPLVITTATTSEECNDLQERYTKHYVFKGVKPGITYLNMISNYGVDGAQDFAGYITTYIIKVVE